MRGKRRITSILMAGVLPLLANDDILIPSKKNITTTMIATNHHHVASSSSSSSVKAAVIIEEDDHHDDDDDDYNDNEQQDEEDEVQRNAAEVLHDDALTSIPALPIDLTASALVGNHVVMVGETPPPPDILWNDLQSINQQQERQQQQQQQQPSINSSQLHYNKNNNDEQQEQQQQKEEEEINHHQQQQQQRRRKESNNNNDDGDRVHVVQLQEDNIDQSQTDTTETHIQQDDDDQEDQQEEHPHIDETIKQSEQSVDDNSSNKETNQKDHEDSHSHIDTLSQQRQQQQQEQQTINTDSTSNKHKDQDEEVVIVERLVVDYASKSAGAIILEKSPSIKGTSNLLHSDRDKYAIVPCIDDGKFVVIGLSEDILVKQVVIANYERYSSHVHQFQVLASQTMAASDWTLLGTFHAKPFVGKSSAEQPFDLPEPAWARYLKFKFITHFGSEHYCTLSQIKVHGSTMLQGFHEQWQKEEEQKQGDNNDNNNEQQNQQQQEKENNQNEKRYNDNEQTEKEEKEENYMEKEKKENNQKYDETNNQQEEKENKESTENEKQSQEQKSNEQETRNKQETPPDQDDNNNNNNDMTIPRDTEAQTKENDGDHKSSGDNDDDDNNNDSDEKETLPQDVIAAVQIPNVLATFDPSEMKNNHSTDPQATPVVNKRANEQQPSIKEDEEIKESKPGGDDDLLNSVKDALKSVMSEASTALKSVQDAPGISNVVKGLQQKLIRVLGTSTTTQEPGQEQQEDKEEIIVTETPVVTMDNQKEEEQAIDTAAPKVEPIEDDDKDVSLDNNEEELSNQEEEQKEEKEEKEEQQQEEEKEEGEQEQEVQDELVNDAVSQELKTDVTAKSEKPAVEVSSIDKKRSDNNEGDLTNLAARLLTKFPSAACLEKLPSVYNFKADSNSGGGTASGVGGSNGTGGKMEPIFKTLTNEIKALQLEQNAHHQYSRAVISCFQTIITEMLSKWDNAHGALVVRLELLELKLQQQEEAQRRKREQTFVVTLMNTLKWAQRWAKLLWRRGFDIITHFVDTIQRVAWETLVEPIVATPGVLILMAVSAILSATMTSLILFRQGRTVKEHHRHSLCHDATSSSSFETPTATVVLDARKIGRKRKKRNKNARLGGDD